MIGRDEVKKLLARLLSSGPIVHLPRKFSDTETFMALAASSFNVRRQYSEKEVNDHLVHWLEGFTYPTSLDHVAVRRYLIDLKFLLRNPSGSSYWTNEAVIASVLEPEARTIQPRDVLSEIQRQREERKRSNTPPRT